MKEYEIGTRIKIVLNQHQQALKEHEGIQYTIINRRLHRGRKFYELRDDTGKSTGWWHPAYFDEVREDFLKSEDLNI